MPKIVSNTRILSNAHVFISLTIGWVVANFHVVPRQTSPIRFREAPRPSEDYLERILELINSKGYARVVDIASSR